MVARGADIGVAGDGARRCGTGPARHLAVAMVLIEALEGAPHHRLRDEKRYQSEPGKPGGAEWPKHDGKRYTDGGARGRHTPQPPTRRWPRTLDAIFASTATNIPFDSGRLTNQRLLIYSHHGHADHH